jgi:hypothetical protein
MVEVAKDLRLHMVVQFSFFFTSFVPDSRASEQSVWMGESGLIPKGLVRFEFLIDA